MKRKASESIRKVNRKWRKLNKATEGEQNINILSWASVGTSSKTCQDWWIKIDWKVDSSSRFTAILCLGHIIEVRDKSIVTVHPERSQEGEG